VIMSGRVAPRAFRRAEAMLVAPASRAGCTRLPVTGLLPAFWLVSDRLPANHWIGHAGICAEFGRAALIAMDLLCWLRLLCLDRSLADAEPKTLRYRLCESRAVFPPGYSPADRLPVRIPGGAGVARAAGRTGPAW
jgi:hypothetical protein